MTALNNKFFYETYHNRDEHSTKEEVDDRSVNELVSDQPLVNVEPSAAAARSRSNLLKQLDFELPRAYRSFGKIKYFTAYLIIGISDENAQCNQCSVTFKSSVQLNTHTILYHYGDRVDLQSLAYECCGKCSRRYATLDRLINEHSISDCSVDERRTRLVARDICVCVFCGAAVVCARLIGHLRSVHADEMCDRKLPINSFICRWCAPPPVAYSNIISFIHHVSVTHPSAFRIRQLDQLNASGSQRVKAKKSFVYRGKMPPTPVVDDAQTRLAQIELTIESVINSSRNYAADKKKLKLITTSGNHQCDQCKCDLMSAESLAIHRLAHDCIIGDATITIRCPICSILLDDRVLWNHVIQQHYQRLVDITGIDRENPASEIVAGSQQYADRGIECDQCSIGFRHFYLKYLHMVLLHNTQIEQDNNNDRYIYPAVKQSSTASLGGQFRCIICSAQFYTESVLSQHRAHLHADNEFGTNRAAQEIIRAHNWASVTNKRVRQLMLIVMRKCA